MTTRQEKAALKLLSEGFRVEAAGRELHVSRKNKPVTRNEIFAVLPFVHFRETQMTTLRHEKNLSSAVIFFS